MMLYINNIILIENNLVSLYFNNSINKTKNFVKKKEHVFISLIMLLINKIIFNLNNDVNTA